MGSVNIASKQAGLRALSSEPAYSYFFEKSDMPVEVNKEHAEKILKNPNFYEYKGKNQIKSDSDNWKKELESINGIGKKTALDIIKIFPTKEMLVEEVNKKKPTLPFDSDVEDALINKYLNDEE